MHPAAAPHKPQARRSRFRWRHKSSGRRGAWLAADQNIRTKYGWFVSYFLHSAEHVFLIYPKDPEWRAAISNQVCFHRAFLKDNDYQTNLKLHYNEKFRQLVDEALSKCKP